MSKKGRQIEIKLSDSINVKDSLELKSFTSNLKKFVVHTVTGWFPSLRKDLSPEGVQKVRIIDRKNMRYKEKVVDVKTGRVIRDVDQNLDDHK